MIKRCAKKNIFKTFAFSIFFLYCCERHSYFLSYLFMKILIIVGGVIVCALCIWIIGSYIAVRTLEEPKYTIISQQEWYEVRQYNSYLAAQVEVNGTQDQALNSGFRLLAGYIFGWNNSGDSIAMTVPVSETQSEQISMTLPVSNTLASGNTRIVQFSMPSKYTLENIPKPNNNSVQLKQIYGYKAAVLRYGWYSYESRVEKMKIKLTDFLTRDSQLILWDISSAQYNPPFSFPLMRRNEIIIPIQ